MKPVVAPPMPLPPIVGKRLIKRSFTHRSIKDPVYIDRKPAPVEIPDEPMVATLKNLVETTRQHYSLTMYLWIYRYLISIRRTVLITT